MADRRPWWTLPNAYNRMRLDNQALVEAVTAAMDDPRILDEMSAPAAALVMQMLGEVAPRREERDLPDELFQVAPPSPSPLGLTIDTTRMMPYVDAPPLDTRRLEPAPDAPYYSVATPAPEFGMAPLPAGMIDGAASPSFAPGAAPLPPLGMFPGEPGRGTPAYPGEYYEPDFVAPGGPAQRSAYPAPFALAAPAMPAMGDGLDATSANPAAAMATMGGRTGVAHDWLGSAPAGISTLPNYSVYDMRDESIVRDHRTNRDWSYMRHKAGEDALAALGPFASAMDPGSASVGGGYNTDRGLRVARVPSDIPMASPGDPMFEAYPPDVRRDFDVPVAEPAPPVGERYFGLVAHPSYMSFHDRAGDSTPTAADLAAIAGIGGLSFRRDGMGVPMGSADTSAIANHTGGLSFGGGIMNAPGAPSLPPPSAGGPTPPTPARRPEHIEAAAAASVENGAPPEWALPLAIAGFTMMQTPGDFFSQVGAGGSAGVAAYMADEQRDQELAQQEVENQHRRAQTDALLASIGQTDRQIDIDAQRAAAAARAADAQVALGWADVDTRRDIAALQAGIDARRLELEESGQEIDAAYKQALAEQALAGAENLRANPDSAARVQELNELIGRGVGLDTAIRAVWGDGSSAQSTADRALIAAFADIASNVAMSPDEKAEAAAFVIERVNSAMGMLYGGPAPTTRPAVPAPGADGVVRITPEDMGLMFGSP